MISRVKVALPFLHRVTETEGSESGGRDRVTRGHKGGRKGGRGTGIQEGRRGRGERLEVRKEGGQGKRRGERPSEEEGREGREEKRGEGER